MRFLVRNSPCQLQKGSGSQEKCLQSYGKSVIYVGTHPAHTFTASNLLVNRISPFYVKFREYYHFLTLIGFAVIILRVINRGTLNHLTYMSIKTLQPSSTLVLRSAEKSTVVL